MNEKRSLYTRQVGLRSPEWEDVDAEKVVMPGNRVATLGTDAAAPLLRESADAFLMPTIRPLPQGSSFVRDDAELQTRIKQGQQLLDVVSARVPAPGALGEWAAFETAQAEKITWQRGASPMWWVQPGGYVTEDKPSMRDAFAIMARRYAQPGTVAARYKQGTNHGFPMYKTTWADYMLHAFWAAASGPDYDAFAKLGTRLASHAGQGDTPLSMIQFNRSGPTKKVLPGYSATLDGAVHDCNLTSLAPRRRGVNGIPSAANMVQQAAVSAAQLVVYLDERRHHNGHQDVANKLRAHYAPGKIVVSDDISSFDMSVAYNHQLEMDKYLWTPLLGAAMTAFKADVRTMPLLIPPLFPHDAGFLCTRRGTTASGDLTTALDGGWINEGRIMTALALAKGVTVDQIERDFGRKVYYLIQGDDTVMIMDKGYVDLDKYAAASASLGYSTKMAMGAVFLMTLHDPATGGWCPLASRVFQQTVFNEYGGTSTAMEVFSWIARTPSQFWEVNPWAREVASLLASSHCFHEWGVSPTRASDALASHAFNHALAATLRAHPEAVRRAQHVPGTEALVDAGLVSDAASALLSGPGADAALPIITKSDAATAALHLADWLSAKKEARNPPLIKQLNLGSDSANAYLRYITTDREDE